MGSLLYRVVSPLLMVPSCCAPEVAGGCDFVRKTLAAFTPETAGTTLMVDLHGYDSFPVLAALEACLSNILEGRSTKQSPIKLFTHPCRVRGKQRDFTFFKCLLFHH